MFWVGPVYGVTVVDGVLIVRLRIINNKILKTVHNTGNPIPTKHSDKLLQPNHLPHTLPNNPNIRIL